jgi:cytochrome c551/c552
MKRVAMILAGLALAAAGAAQASEDLAKKSGCLTCHNVTGAKKMGPSFKDASAKGEAAILASLNDAKKHGAVKASAEDKATLAKWIAGMK